MANTSYSNANRYQQSNGRWVGIGVVVLLHVVVIYLFVYALGSRAVELIKGPIKVENIKIEKPKDEEPPPPPPKMELPPPPFVPPPEIQITTPPPAPTAIQTVTTTVPVAPAPVAAKPAPPAPVAATPPRIVNLPNSEKYYPPISKRLGEEGTATLQVTVATNGAIVDCRVVKSSGFERLDTAGCNAVRSGEAKVTPGMNSEGQPMQQSLEFKYRFQLR